jgi:hypothetical protein
MIDGEVTSVCCRLLSRPDHVKAINGDTERLRNSCETKLNYLEFFADPATLIAKYSRTRDLI